jgi:hypothetical protein
VGIEADYVKDIRNNDACMMMMIEMMVVIEMMIDMMIK